MRGHSICFYLEMREVIFKLSLILLIRSCVPCRGSLVEKQNLSNLETGFQVIKIIMLNSPEQEMF